MLKENDQLSLHLGYNFLPRVALSTKDKENLSLLSGTCLEVAYKHFFTNGTFVGMNVGAAYYRGAPNDLLYAMKLKDKGNITSRNANTIDVKIIWLYGVVKLTYSFYKNRVRSKF